MEQDAEPALCVPLQPDAPFPWLERLTQMHVEVHAKRILLSTAESFELIDYEPPLVCDVRGRSSAREVTQGSDQAG
jgi:hypothetical protein